MLGGWTGFHWAGVMRRGRGLAQDKSPRGRLIEGNNPAPCRPGVKYNRRGAAAGGGGALCHCVRQTGKPVLPRGKGWGGGGAKTEPEVGEINMFNLNLIPSCEGERTAASQ